MSLLPTYRGIKIKPYMVNLRYYVFSFFFLLFSPLLAFFVYSNFEKIKNVDIFSIVVSVVMLILIVGVSVYLTWLSQERVAFFQKIERLAKLAFFLKENGYAYTKKVKTESGTVDKVTFPTVYLKQNRYDLEVAFKMAGNRFQDKFKKIGSDLETTFFMDFMEVQDDIKFKTYKMAYSAFLNRIKENGYAYTKKVKTESGTVDKVTFPTVYLKQNRYDLEVAFKMAGNRFQDKFKKIGSDLETTFFMDFMEVQDDIKFKTYKMAYSAFLNRIKVIDVEYSDKGIQLMKNLWWNPIDDPHLLVVGGTGGGKTVLLRTLIRALAKVGVVDIGDPKQADFVTMAEQKAFEGRISYKAEDIVAMIERGVDIMFARYAYIRQKRTENGDKDLKKFYEYGLEPYFIVCDEYNALCAMLDFQTRQRLDNAMGQFLLLGRQAGCFAITAMQKPSREDLGSKLQANINFRISVGRLDEVGYDLTFGEVNRNKEFKYVKYLGGKRVYGRGYACVYGEVAREFYSPLLEKKFSFYDEYEKIERRENPFNPLENPNAELSEEEKENLQAEMEAQEELEKGEVKKADPGLVQELMSSKQKETGNDLVRTFAFSKEIGVSAGSMRNLVDKLDGILEFEKEDNVVYLDKVQRNIIKDLFELKQGTTQNWSEILEDFPFDEY